MRNKIDNNNEVIDDNVNINNANNTNIEAKPITRGSIVRFTGTKSYSGISIPQYRYGEYKVKEVSEDRVVLSKGQEIVAAVNIADCVKLY